MEDRFRLKDFVFVVLFVMVLGAVIGVGYQFNYQERRLTGLQGDIDRVNEVQKQQLQVLGDIRAALRQGVRVNAGSGTEPAQTGIIRRKNPDGSLYVYYPDPPKSPRDPHDAVDYALGDWLVQNLGEEPKLIAPFIEKDYYGQLVHEPVLESLVARNPQTFEYEPILAESYTESADGLHFRFVLRKNLTFSDGHPLTADDVVFSFKTVKTPGVDCAAVAQLLRARDRLPEGQTTGPSISIIRSHTSTPWASWGGWS